MQSQMGFFRLGNEGVICAGSSSWPYHIGQSPQWPGPWQIVGLRPMFHLSDTMCKAHSVISGMAQLLEKGAGIHCDRSKPWNSHARCSFLSRLKAIQYRLGTQSLVAAPFTQQLMRQTLQAARGANSG